MRFATMRTYQQHPWRRRSISCSRCARHLGFSLIELVVVVLIMSILVAAAVPKFVDSLLFHRVETAARRVKSDFELARNTARLTSAIQTITFSGTTYTTSAAVKDLDRHSDTYTVDLADTPYDIATVTADFGGNAFVSFDGYANPSSGGTVLVKIDNDHQCTVTLDATTGHVTITSNHSRARSAEAVGN